MAFRYRSDIAGKRFVAVKRGVKLKHKEYQNWDWQSGIIRASSDRDYLDPEVTILAEFVNQDWKKRQVIKIQEEYQLFLVEKTLVKVSARREDNQVIPLEDNQDTFVALSFEAIIGPELLGKLVQVPVIKLVGLTLHFVKESLLTYHQEEEQCDRSTEEREAVQQWYSYQDSQQLLLQTPTVLVGYRVKVYRSEGTTQWYTAILQRYCEKTQELVVTDDTVLEEHREDPALLEIHLLGDRVIESILRGDDVRVRPSRTCRSHDKGNKSSTLPSRSTALKRRSCFDKAKEVLNQEKKGDKHVKRKSLPCLLQQKNIDRENKKSSSVGLLLDRTVVSKRAKSQETFEVALRDADNHKTSKSLVVPLLDISPKKLKDRRDLSWSSEKGDKVVINGDTPVSASKSPDGDSSGVRRACSASKESSIHSANKGNKCDNTPPPSAASPTKKRTRKIETAELLSSSTSANNNLRKTLVDQQNNTSRKKGNDHQSALLISESLKSPHKNSSKTAPLPEKSNPCKSTTKKQKTGEKNQGSSSANKKSSPCDNNNKKPGGCISRKERSLPHSRGNNSNKSILGSSAAPSPQYHNNKAVVAKADSGSGGSSREEKPLSSETRLITQECSLVSSSSRHKEEEESQDLVVAAALLVGSTRNGCNKQQQKKLVEHSVKYQTENISGKQRKSVVVVCTTASCSTGSSSSTLSSSCDSTALLQNQKVNISCISSSSIDSSPLSAQVAAQGKLLLSSSHSSTTKCIAKAGVHCSGVDYLLCEGKVSLHSQECSHSAHTSPSKRTTTSTTAVVTPTYGAPHAAHNIPVSADTLTEENKDMYYKKTLLGDYQRKESGGHTSPEKGENDKGSLNTTGINLNQSLTDQLARRNTAKPEQRRSWEDVMKSTSSNGLDLPPKVSDSYSGLSVDVTTSPSFASTVDKRANLRALEATYHSSVSTDKPRIDESGQRSKSAEPKAGPSGNNNSLPRDLRTEDRNRERDSVKSSNSPLLVDKARPVEPYRDPELLKKDELLRIHTIQKQQVHVPLTHPSMNPPNVPPPALQGHPSSHAAAHPMLSHMNAAAAAAAAASGVAPLPSQLAAIQEQAFAAQINYLRSLAIHQQSSMTPLTFTGIQNPYQTRQLEMLWQQKFPNIQVPPGWLLHQYQDELLRDVSHVTPNLLQRRDILDREMRERELALERERMDREIREREERERTAERERIERERQERDRQERERQERDRREREERERIEVEKRERERQDRERREKERQQEQQRERERREILHESKAAADAVEKHFQESLNRLSQRALSTGTWFPGGPNAKPSPLQSLASPKSYPQPPPGSTSAFNSVSMGKPPHNTLPPPPHTAGGMDRKMEEKPKLTDYTLAGHAQPHLSSGGGLGGGPHPGMRANHSPSETKPRLSPQDLSQRPRSSESDVKPAITLRESLIKGFPSEPMNLRSETKAFPGYPGYPPLKETMASAAMTATTSASGNPSTAGHQIKQEPNFSLYGYPYQQPNPMYISQDKLVQGLKEEKGIKQEPTDLRTTPLSSPPPLVKTEQKPVIGESKPDVRSLGGGHGSITLGTSRGQLLPQQQESKAGVIVASTSAQNSPMRVASPQQLLQSMKSGQPIQSSQVPAPKSHMPPLSSAAQTTAAFTMVMQQAYMEAMAQSSIANMAQNSMTNMAQSSMANMTQNSMASMAHNSMASMAQNSMGNMALHQGSGLINPSKDNPQLSPTSQKRRSQQKEAGALVQDTKKSKVDPVTSGSKPSTGTYIDSFKSFVENAVQSAFLQDSDAAERMRLNPHFMQHLSVPPKPYDIPQLSRTQQKQSPSKEMMMAAVSSSGSSTGHSSNAPHPAVIAGHTATEEARMQTLQQQQQQQPVPPFVPKPQLPTSSSTNTSTTSVPHSSGLLPKGVSNSGISHPGPVSTPGSVSSISSIQETINRVANGNLDTDSDTLSAPSPPPTLKSSFDAPSPIRVNNPGSKPSFKKAILARYSEDTVPHCENSNSSLCDQSSPPKIDKHEKMDTSSPVAAVEGIEKGDSNISKPPPPQPNMKSPLDSLKEAEKEEMTTSASEAEQQDCDGKSQGAKGKKKTSKRKSEGVPAGSSSKKQKAIAASNSDAESGSNTDVPSKKKKKNNGKNKSEDNDSNGNKKKSSDVLPDTDGSSLANSSSTVSNHNTTTTSTHNKSNKAAKELGRSSEEGNNQSLPLTSASSTNPPTTSLSSTVSSVVSRTSSTAATTSVLGGVCVSRSPLTLETERSDLEKVKVEEKPAEVAGPKKSVWDCEKKLKEWEKKQAQREKEGKKGKKGDRSGGEKGGSHSKGDSGGDKETSKDDNPSSILANKPLNKDPVNKLKKNQEPFLQDASCGEIAPKLMKCRECKMRNKKLPNIFCRFYAFRRLKYNPKGCVSIAGFSEPSDADVDDIELWYPRYPPISPTLDLDMAKYVMANLGDRFCELVEQEKEAMMWVSADCKIVWKRAVQGVREMCDVCETTLFNMHWCCHKCGFVVCIDCYRNKAKKTGSNQDKSCKVNEEATSNQKWLTCSANRQQHEPDKLKITQIIPSDVLWALGSMLHEVRDNWNMQSNCPCGHTSKVNQVMSAKNGMSQHLFSTAVSQCMNAAGGEQLKDRPLVNGIGTTNNKKKPVSNSPLLDSNSLNGSPLMSPLNILAEAAASRESESKKEGGGGGEAGGTGGKEAGGNNNKMCSTLRDLLTRQGTAPAGGKPPGTQDNSKKPKGISGLENILQEVVEKTHQKSAEDGGTRSHHHRRHQGIKTLQMSHYKPRSGSQMQGRSSPIPMYSVTETSALYPDIAHSWLDDGRLLRLHDARCQQNMQLFQQQWRRGQPIIVSHCDKFLNSDIWTPKAFGKEFGELENDLVNCSTGVAMLGHKMKVFWDGFQKMGARLKDGKNRPLILKLKDWPPTEDFSDLMPSRFQDLMQALPLPEYTQRTGTFNLASRLPEFFVKPDLGPKMYNAYGSAMQPKTGSTNLHLDMSDAVNLMIYVGIPEDDKEAQEKAAMETMKEANCCEFTKDRARTAGEKPGALWHIFDALDADKIRDLLNKVAVERGEKIDLNHDPIHDQAWYLNTELRERLLNEYGVQGYSIVQYLGDAVFIPAGAPHQVKNLHSCIKAAEDFVSPENINHCFKMTQEFRYLSETHSNHEDKLQIKNIIYHAVKDAVAVLKENDPTIENPGNK